MQQVDPYTAPITRSSPADLTVADLKKYDIPPGPVKVEGYRPAVKHFDHYKKKYDDENYEYNSKGKKRPASANPVGDTEAEKKPPRKKVEVRDPCETPGPWQYNIEQQWIKTPAWKRRKEIPSADRQTLQFKWQGVPEKQRNYQSQAELPQKKPDFSVGNAKFRPRSSHTLTTSS